MDIYTQSFLAKLFSTLHRVIEPLTWEEPWEAKVAPPSSCHTSGEADGRLALAVLPVVAATSAAISSRPLLRWKIKGSDLRRTPSTAGGAHERRRRPQRKKARSERCALRGRYTLLTTLLFVITPSPSDFSPFLILLRDPHELQWW